MPKTISKKWTLGLIMLGIVVILWVLSSFLINLIFEDGSYRKPFFITYINTASFVFYLLPTLKAIIYNYRTTGEFRIHEELIMEEEGSLHNGSENVEPTLSTSLIPKDGDGIVSTKLSLPATVKLSAQFCILWFAANLVTNASLSYTSVASQTILSSTSSFFTLLVGALCHAEVINRIKVIGSIVSFIGIVLVTRSYSTACQTFQ